MKKYFLPVVILHLSIINNKIDAQDSSLKKTDTHPAIYASLSAGYANKGEIYGAGASIVFKTSWGIGFSVKKNFFRAKQIPADYYPAATVLGTDHIPEDYYIFYSVGLLKETDIDFGKIKFGLEADASLVIYGCNSFKSIWPTQGAFGHSSNYETVFEKKESPGVSIRPKMRYVLSRNFEVEFSPSLSYNKFQTSCSLELSIIFGRLFLNKK